MITEKTNISARVEITLKKIVYVNSYWDADKTITSIQNDSNYTRIMKQTEYRLIEERKYQLERELRNL